MTTIVRSPFFYFLPQIVQFLPKAFHINWTVKTQNFQRSAPTASLQASEIGEENRILDSRATVGSLCILME